MKPIILTLIGNDKPGLIESLAQKVYSIEGNWLSSNFSHMAGQFAGFVELNIPADKHQGFVEYLNSHPDLTIHSVSTESADESSDNVAQIEIIGNDKPGIVQELTSVLHGFNINIVKFTSGCESAPNWGSLLFKAQATVTIPEGFDTDQLTGALEEVANDLVVDVTIK
ncbi:MAG: ACT domain-containing protein [Aliiglaciecola sp.]